MFYAASAFDQDIGSGMDGRHRDGLHVLASLGVRRRTSWDGTLASPMQHGTARVPRRPRADDDVVRRSSTCATIQ